MFLVTVIFLIEFIFLFFFLFRAQTHWVCDTRHAPVFTFLHFIEQLPRHLWTVDPFSISCLKGVFIWFFFRTELRKCIAENIKYNRKKKRKPFICHVIDGFKSWKILPFCYPGLDYQITKQQINGKQLIFRENTRWCFSVRRKGEQNQI